MHVHVHNVKLYSEQMVNACIVTVLFLDDILVSSLTFFCMALFGEEVGIAGSK